MSTDSTAAGVPDLGTMSWTDLDGPADRPIVVVPLGSCEQHGPHLPLHTDTVIAVELARALVARQSGCVVAPPLTIAASGEHQGFPGTLSIGTEATTTVVVELVRSADWANGVVLVNGHGGNAAALAAAAAVCRREGRRVLVWSPSIPDGDLHAGRTETSLMLALRPAEVRADDAVAGPIPTHADLIRHGVRPLSASGVLGDPTAASAAHGRAVFDQMVRQLTAAVADWAGTGATG